MLSYSQRSQLCTNPTAKKLLQLMDTKKTNLSLAIDATQKADLLAIADAVGPEICLLKTHIDIVEDFDQDLINQLTHLAKQHNFLIFEDRKFADIGNTVKLQYAKGIYHIADWANIVNAHPIMGPSVIYGLKEVGLTRGHGLLLLAELSSKDNLAKGDYTQAAIKMAQDNKDFVIGFISQHKLTDEPTFIHLTPGVNISQSGDNLGQNYITPQKAIIDNGSDIIIVGRGIYGANNPAQAAQTYRQAGWDAYQQKMKFVTG